MNVGSSCAWEQVTHIKSSGPMIKNKMKRNDVPLLQTVQEQPPLHNQPHAESGRDLTQKAGRDPAKRPNSQPKPNQNKNHVHSGQLRLTEGWTFDIRQRRWISVPHHIWEEPNGGRSYQEVVRTSSTRSTVCVWHAVMYHSRKVTPRMNDQRPPKDCLMEFHQGADGARDGVLLS